MRETKKQMVFVFYIFLGGPECVGPPIFAYVAHFVFLIDAWIRTQTAAVASSCATNLATHLPKSPTQKGFDGARKRRIKTSHLNSCIAPAQLFFIERGCLSKTEIGE